MLLKKKERKNNGFSYQGQFCSQMLQNHQQPSTNHYVCY